MSLNVLGGRNVRRLRQLTGQRVVWAFVRSHVDAGAVAVFTTADHRHGWAKRETGEWGFADEEHGGCRQMSCRILFHGNPAVAEVERRAEDLRHGRTAAGQDRDIHETHDPEPDGQRRYAGGQTCNRCLMFVAFEGAAYVVSDAGAAPCAGFPPTP